MAPTSIKVSARYGTHMPALLQAVLKTTGPILELGVGVFSTHTLHWLCALTGRPVTTIENNRHWWAWGMQYESPTHQIIRIKDWSDAPIEKPWDVALVDHSPDSRRMVEIRRLAKRARYIICHDANEKYWRQYGYEQVFPEFKYRTLYTAANPNTMVLSNFEDLTDFWGPAHA